MSFEELSHTADIKIRAHEPTLDQLFNEACRALMQVMYGTDIKGGTLRKIELDSPDRESLLLDFLSELLFITDTENFVIARANVQITGNHLHATLDGEPFDPKRHREGTEIKGISYSGMSISEDTEGFVLDVLFDV
jgi:SHS2 domain-containing protein